MQRTIPPKPARVQAGVQLDAELWKQTRKQAIDEGRSAGHIIDDALRAYFKKINGQSGDDQRL
jgi:hypothetical protein